VKLSNVESLELSNMTMADGMSMPAVSQIIPLIVAREGDWAKRLLEHNNSKPKKQRTLLILM
jgi:hypothetical protein